MLSKVLRFNSGGGRWVCVCVGGGGGGGGSNYNFTKECSSCPIVYTYDTFLFFMSSSLGASYEFKYIEIGLFRFLMKTQITW